MARVPGAIIFLLRRACSVASLANMKYHPVKSSPVVAGATSVAALFAASSLDAGIITNTALSLVGATVKKPIIGGVDNFAWDIDGTGGAEMTLLMTDPEGSSTWFHHMKDFANGFKVAAASSYLSNLGLSQYVGNARFKGNSLNTVLSSGYFVGAIGFTSGESGYIGFQFTPVSSPTLYGWAEVVLSERELGVTTSGIFEIVEWAYEDSGANIKTGDTGGAIPEPAGAATGLGLLALGAAGVRRMRRPQAA